MELEIVYQDEYLVAINKPHGLLVHRSKYADEARVFAVQELRNQLGQHVYPCHRIDRKTGGVLLFALDQNTCGKVQQQFMDNRVAKTYLAIVRGYSPESGEINYPLINESGKEQDAITLYETIKQTELEVPFGRFPTSRYSLIKAYPKTGRMHQIRKHMAHIFHPIIADRPHGCNKQNRLFKEKWAMDTMMLHALQLEINHPINQERITINASLQTEFQRMLQLMGWDWTD